MRIRRKRDHCLNCGHFFGDIDNFCPVCGQENNDQNVSFGAVVKDFASTYLALDSKFFKTFIPFFIQPGFLTRAYTDGKRVTYTHPVRLYFVMSLFFFFLLSFVIRRSYHPADNMQLPEVENTTDEGSIISYHSDPSDTTVTDPNEFIISRLDWEMINKLKDNKQLSEQQIMDSMNIGSITPFENRLAKQTIKINRADEIEVISFIFKNFPLMMLFLVPMFAGFLKLAYITKDHLYIKHVIHALHLHSFAYMTYGIALLIGYYDHMNDRAVAIGAFTIVTTYAYFSFLKVYRQPWFFTLIKFNILGLIYAIFIVAFFAFESLLSILIY